MTKTFLGRRLALAACMALLGAGAAAAQSVSFEEYNPKSTLVTKEHLVSRARFPFVDVHSHQRSLTPADVDKLVREMDAMNMRVMVNLSGGTGDRLQQTIQAMKGRYPDRFVVFANLSTDDLGQPGFGQRAAARLEQDVSNGAQGLKIYKNFGMDLKYANGQRVKVDEPEFDPLWGACARLGIPVLIHTGEPSAFFDAIDLNNERLLELTQFPGRARPPDKYPKFEELMAERDRMIARHPKTIFILAHFAYHANDLERLGKLLDRFQNVHVEFAAILAELGRQPYSTHDFMIRYQDRVLFGKDIYEPSEYPYYFRSLETRDEYFEYYRRRHAFWRIYGFGLPDDVLRKIYYANALKLIPGIPRDAFPK